MEIPDIPGDGGIESIPEQGPKEGDNVETNPIIEKTPEDTKFTTPITPQNPDDGKCITYKPPEDPTGGKLTTPILEKQAGDNIEKNESGSDVVRKTEKEVNKTSQESGYTVYIGDDDYIGKTNDFERRKKEWAKNERRISPLHEDIPDNDTALGVEQTEIENNREKGIGPKQRNAVNPNRKDKKAETRRQKGNDYLNEKYKGEE